MLVRTGLRRIRGGFRFRDPVRGCCHYLRLLIRPDRTQRRPFALYFPAVLVTTLIGGIAAAFFRCCSAPSCRGGLSCHCGSNWNGFRQRPSRQRLPLFLLAAAMVVWIAAHIEAH